jgi:hypothetical protein
MRRTVLATNPVDQVAAAGPERLEPIHGLAAERLPMAPARAHAGFARDASLQESTREVRVIQQLQDRVRTPTAYPPAAFARSTR